MSRNRQRARLLTGGVAIGFMGLVSSFPATDASISYNGSDYTEVAGPHYATTCDREPDDHKVRGELDSNNSGITEFNVTDGDGANSVCADVVWDRTVMRHRTCERGSLGIWGCGNFKSHP